MAPARKSTGKSATQKSKGKAPSRKAPTKGSRKAATKKTSKKAASKKAAPKKKTAKKAPPTPKKAAKAGKAAAKGAKATAKAPKKAAKPAESKGRAGRRAPAIRSRKKKQPHVKPPALTGSAGERHSKLGAKWACFSCGAKFYDLNQPEPLCPRCGADQREKPKDAPTPPPPPPPKRETRSLAPYLDDDDAATRNESLTSEDLEMELELGGVGDDEDLEKTASLALDDVEAGSEED